MNKTAIKNFAISARKKLIAMAMDKAGILGITKETIAEPSSRGGDFAVFPTHFGTETRLDSTQLRQRQNLVQHIGEKGYDFVMEEVAYTWFNRLIAVRFMEVNDYLPTRVRVLSSETAGKAEPDIVTLAPNVELGFTAAEVEEIYTLKDDARKSGELFKKLFIKQCNELGKILPQLFEKTADYTELLLDLAWDKEDSVVRELLTIDEADFLEAVEIIGWMYQYYNTEPKQNVFDGLKKNVKITKETIPAATQLFTPDWIVRYMVENSLGRLWLNHLAAGEEGYYYYFNEDGSNAASCYVNANTIQTLKSRWRYYLEEAKQEVEVENRLLQMRDACENMSPEAIKIIDPCMGSGHILVYAFDVLMQIYTSCGYAERDAASLILQKNIYGLDIDKRAYQLTYFALMMKARGYDRRFFTKEVAPQVYCPMGYADGEEYGSLLTVTDLEPKPQEPQELTLFDMDYAEKLNTWNFRRLLAQQYDVVVTNPPYMGASGMSAKLADFVKKNYPDSKADMFACFIERCSQLTKQNCYTAMITQHSWMFLSSFEKLRTKLLLTDTVNMAHLGARAFEEIGGEVVQTTTWVQRNSHVPDYKATYARLVDYSSQQEKENAFLAHINLHTAQQENFSKIPGSPIAYWVSDGFISLFEDIYSFTNIASAKAGLSTTDNDKYLRLWHEIVFSSIGFNYKSLEETNDCKFSYIPQPKGGTYRKWYGNLEYVVDWYDNGTHIRKAAEGASGGRIVGSEFYFKEGLTWSDITSSGKLSVRYMKKGMIFNSSAPSCFCNSVDNVNYLLGCMNSVVSYAYLLFLAPTYHFNAGPISRIPVIIDEEKRESVDTFVLENISLSKFDWDSFETSWDFKKHPLI